VRFADRLKLSLVALACAGSAHALAPELACLPAAQSGVAADAARARVSAGEGMQITGPAQAGNAMRGERLVPSLQLFSDARAMDRDKGARPLLAVASTPEPTGWAMLLAGVLVIAAIARRWSSWPVD